MLVGMSKTGPQSPFSHEHRVKMIADNKKVLGRMRENRRA